MALNLLKDGQSLTIGDLRLGIEESGSMYITGWTQYLDINNLSKAKALQELSEIKALFYDMVSDSKELEIFIVGKSLKFNLAFNYGKGGFGICSEKNGIITWETGLNKN
jgi:hypothetical protein